MKIRSYRKFGQLLQDLPGGDGGVVGCAAADQEKATTATDFRNEVLKWNIIVK